MGSLDQVPGAGLLLTGDSEIVDANDRSQIVFKTDTETICGQSLESLRRRGVLDEETVTAWQRAVDEATDGEISTEQIRLRPFGSEQVHHYRLQAEPLEDEHGACCSLRSSDTDTHYVETITSLHSATRELIQANEINEVLQRTAVAASEVLEFPGTAVRRYDPETELLRHVAFGSQVENLDSRPPYALDDSPHGQAFQKGTTVIDDIGEDDPYDREVFTQTMYVPIGRVGLLSIGTLGSDFDEVDVHLAEILGDNATAAIEIVDTAESLREERKRLDLLEQILSRVLRHNIRNKMTIIKGNAQSLKQQDSSDESHLDDIIESVDEVIELSEKARQLENIVADPFSHRTLELDAALDNAIRTVARRYPDATIDAPAATGERISAHESFPIALENLLENACQHAGREPEITVEVTRTDETVVIRILDDGPGIPQAEVEAINNRAETALEHPSGLGLWIVDWLVDRSGGEISFDVDGGTAVELRLDRVRGVP